ncbi:protein mono-ADP-ribosyltransferase PARP9 isoform X2 [Pseudoliparis swirei]|uniref:protein mono-ADP-ribosyltransferase PARP9 isoform X2 n=1 Tax=Pseudoliparis swirei TaxID=2059687 RepID=UPI0024BE2D46|nr:protein mono-ADP-ribosyltransferase PARP9 isoform X2 [Pseudoliparis swirei]
MASQLDIPLRGTSLNIVRRCSSHLSAVLESKFGCKATVHGVDFERDPRGPPWRSGTVPEKRFTTTLHGGVELSVWKADLADFEADAVVNAANKRLQHDSGLAKALSIAGGPQIQRESADYIAKRGPLETGDALVLGAGLLRCKKIIHAVGPRLYGNYSKYDFPEAERLLRKVIASILDKVKENRLQSVAIPAISSGLFNFPLPQCADAIVSSVRQYYESASYPGHLPKEILLVNHDERSVAEMERACRQMSASGKSSGGAETSAPPVQPGKVRLTVKKGSIEEQKTDVIVNTTSMDGPQKSGQISKAIFEKGGTEMQQEFYRAHAQRNIKITKGHRLHCKEVFHTVCVERGNDAACQILFDAVLNCLKLAALRKHKSISFPAIGTGNLGFGEDESAQIMSQAVADFTRSYRDEMDVYFVIFQKDASAFKAFDERMSSVRPSASDPGFTQETEHRGGGVGAPTPQISLTGPSNEATHEAERWLSGLLFGSGGAVRICNNFVQHFGERENLQLSHLLQIGVSIEEFFERGRAGLIVSGASVEDVGCACLQVEAMLCSIQGECVAEEERATLTPKNPSFQRKPVDHTSQKFSVTSSDLKKHGLQILKVDEVENSTLERLFALKRKQLGCTDPARIMLQRIPAHFCEMVSRIGFRAEYAPPDEPAFGEGIYFAGKMKKALDVWKVREKEEEYLYFVEAEVLTGRSTPGEPGLILPPAVGENPLVTYDSVSGPDVSVIFSSYQALPRYVITCKTL